MRREEEQKARKRRKAEERKAKEEERKRKMRELKAKRAELKHELHQVLEALRKETEYRRRHEGELVERIRTMKRRINTGLPADERKSARLRLEGLKDQLEELRKGSAATILKLKAEKAVLKAKLNELKSVGKAPATTGPTEFYPVLVVVDDRSRYMYALEALPSATAEEIRAVLERVLPPTGRYLISDNGPQFVSEELKGFCEGEPGILHVRIHPHHPRENGRCERPIRTVKDLLELHDWNDLEEFVNALDDVTHEYNNTPHQGIGYLTPAAYQFQGVICQA